MIIKNIYFFKMSQFFKFFFLYYFKMLSPLPLIKLKNSNTITGAAVITKIDPN